MLCGAQKFFNCRKIPSRAFREIKWRTGRSVIEATRPQSKFRELGRITHMIEHVCYSGLFEEVRPKPRAGEGAYE